jgi:hypothetical protein
MARLAAKHSEPLSEVHVIWDGDKKVSPGSNPLDQTDKQISWRLVQMLHNAMEHNHVELGGGRHTFAVERDELDADVGREVQDHLSRLPPNVPFVLQVVHRNACVAKGSEYSCLVGGPGTEIEHARSHGKIAGDGACDILCTGAQRAEISRERKACDESIPGLLQFGFADLHATTLRCHTAGDPGLDTLWRV